MGPIPAAARPQDRRPTVRRALALAALAAAALALAAGAGAAVAPAGLSSDTPPVSAPAADAPPRPAPLQLPTAPAPAGPPAFAPPILDWPVEQTPERWRLMALYLQRHHGGPFTGDPEVDTRMSPRAVVLHWTGSPRAKSAFFTFQRVRQRGQRDRSEPNAVNLSSHFVVERDGTIFRLLPETRMGRHTIGLNHLAIGVENVGDGRNWPLTPAQVEANIALVRWLHSRHPITHLLAHGEYRRMEGHPYFRERVDSFRTGRVDPGVPFMAAVRAGLADLPLQGPPPGPAPRRRLLRGSGH